MKTFLVAAALVAATSASIGTALAEGPRPSGGAYVASAPAVTGPHYEWQYSYVGHHPRYRGH
ncbi:MAG: hypothetical protein JO001_16820 [Alphaproteobacteria bacterium]|nr:hypothetical protein [Alphaproteobacteria bacterium]